jgi:hypothetical protein
MLVPFGILAFMVVLTAQPRPALVSLLGLLATAHLAERALLHGKSPPWWSAVLIALWANVHGLWLAGPLALGVAAALNWLGQQSPRRRPPAGLWAVVASWVVAGMITPLGPSGLLLPLALRDATRHIQEWQPSTPWSLAFVPLALELLIFVWGSRRSSVLRRPEVVIWIILWVLFSLPALRNVIVSAFMLLPLAATVLGTSGWQPSTPGRPPLRGIVAISYTILALIVGVAAMRLVTLQPLENAQPLRIARELSTHTEPVRVLNDYNTAGVLVAFGPSAIELGIDGRADRYGATYIDEYLRVFAVRGDAWRTFLEEFDPDVAVVKNDEAIRYVLEDVQGWKRDMVDGDYVLLRAPQPR